MAAFPHRSAVVIPENADSNTNWESYRIRGRPENPARVGKTGDTCCLKVEFTTTCRLDERTTAGHRAGG